MSRDSMATLMSLLGELEGHLDSHPDPQLTELRQTIGAALAALYRANAEARLRIGDLPMAATRH